MSSCCALPDEQGSPCPRCGAVGPVVGPEVVRPHRPGAPDGPWQFCPTRTCPVVYHLGDDPASAPVTVDELRTRVDHKAGDAPDPVCYCFSHTADDLAADLAEHGTSTIKDAIKAAVAGGFCACEHLNPSGSCCLPDIHRTLRALKAGATTTP